MKYTYDIVQKDYVKNHVYNNFQDMEHSKSFIEVKKTKWIHMN